MTHSHQVLKMSEKHLRSGKMYGLKEAPWATHAAYVESAKRAKVDRRLSRDVYIKLLQCRVFKILKPDNTSCGMCLELGWEGFKEYGVKFLDLIFEQNIMKEKQAFGQEDYKRRLLNLFAFMRTEYTCHLQEDSPVASHCLRSKLGSRADNRLDTKCDHGESGTRSASIPPVFNGLRQSKCHCCGKDGTTNHGRNLSKAFYSCKYCDKVCCAAHKLKMGGNGESLGPEQESTHTIVCAECSSVIEEATHSNVHCGHCDEIQYFCKDVANLVRMCQESEHVDATTKGDIQKMCDSFLDSITKFSAHMQRVSNQNRFWSDRLDAMATNKEFDLVMVMSDFWKKFEGTAMRRKNCEKGEKQSVETHVFWSLLPPRDHPGVDWRRYPAGSKDTQPDDNGHRGFVVHVYNLFSNDVAQTSHQALCNILSVYEHHHKKMPHHIR